MATSQRQLDARRFVASGFVLSLGLFGGLRLPWIESQLVLPLTQLQGYLAFALFGLSAPPVTVTLACSGADALALCVGAVLAYPVGWRARTAGAVGGIALILALNTLRIGSLGLVAGSPAWFDRLHLYGWPAVLTLAIAGYVFGWMHLAARPESADSTDVALAATRRLWPWQPSRRFLLLTAGLVIAFAAVSPYYLTSPAVLALAGGIASAAAAILQAFGSSAHASANLLATPHGIFAVTQECIATPLIPVYLAAVGAYAKSRREAIFGVLAALPLFTGLGIVRLLLVAIPTAGLATPTFMVHAFYQLLLGIVVVAVAAQWRHSGRAAMVHAAAGVAAACLFIWLLGPAYTWAITPRGASSIDDPQGALAFLPSFQVAIYLALAIVAHNATRWTRLAAGFGMLTLTQVVGLLGLHALAVIGFAAHVRDVRAWAIVAPVVIFAVAVNRDRTPR